MLRLVTYLSPSIPAELFHLIAADIGASVSFEEAISGPQPGDEEPFTRGAADVGFICAPSFRFLNAEERTVELLPLPVPVDPRANGEPVYFADVVVRADSTARSLDELRGLRWAYNDRNSKSGWFSLLERCGEPDAFFSAVVASGSHLRSLEMVARGEADAAAIDSNVLRLRGTPELRVLESWGPFPIQPAIIRAAMPEETKARVAQALLTIHERHGDALQRLGVARFTVGDERAYR